MPRRVNRRRQWSRNGICWLLIILLYSLFINIYPRDSKGLPKGQPTNQSDIPALESKSTNKQKGYTIGVNVDLVLLYASVYDKDGSFVSGLNQSNFTVYEDGIEQEIVSFSQEDVPVSMGILLDLSGSMRGRIDQINKAALAFIQASNPQDQVFLIGFNEEVELLQDFTNDIDEITDALENTVVTGGTAVYDAIYLGVQKAQQGTNSKKAIVVISDGEDRDSYYKLDDLISKVQELDVQIFCIGFLNTIPEKGFFGRWSRSIPEKARDALETISQDTGGKAYFPEEVSEIHGIVSEIAHDLRSQYSIGYFSSNNARDGSWRQIRIKLNGLDDKHNKTRYRRGYFAPKADNTSRSSAGRQP
jgi:Ca-activated chloride channel family protein